MSGSKFTISIVAHNRIEATKRCLQSVLRSSTGARIILTDNGSTDGTGAYFDSFLRGDPVGITVIHREQNTGFIAPNNHAFELARKLRATYFIALNNDCTVPAGWLEMLAAPLDKDPNAALSGPDGCCRSLSADFHGFPGDKLEYIEGSCLCAKVELVARHGPLFSDYLSFAYCEDSDLSLRMRSRGYTIHQVPFILDHNGATMKTRDLDPETSRICRTAQAQNAAICVHFWDHYLRLRRFDFPIVVRRNGAHGDVLLTTPIIRAIKKAYPLSPITVETDYSPALFAGNPDVERAVTRNEPVQYWNPVVVDLNGAYECRPHMHYIRAYESAARAVLAQLGTVELRTEFRPDIGAALWSKRVADRLGAQDHPICLLHAGPTGWPGRDYPMERFAEVAHWLQSQGWTVAIVGTQKPQEPLHTFLDLTGQTTFHQLGALMVISSLFLGIDSFPLHMAQAVGCPAIGLFGVTSSKFVMTRGALHIGLDADPAIECAGLRHRLSGSERVDCSPACIESISVERIQEAALTLVRRPQRSRPEKVLA